MLDHIFFKRFTRIHFDDCAQHRVTKIRVSALNTRLELQLCIFIQKLLDKGNLIRLVLSI